MKLDTKKELEKQQTPMNINRQQNNARYSFEFCSHSSKRLCTFKMSRCTQLSERHVHTKQKPSS